MTAITFSSSLLSRRPLCFSVAFFQRPRPHQQIRHATLLRRPKRPYTFTQLVTLSDGSSFLHRTTSPLPIYKSTKDARNSALWNPSSQKLLNVEEDEAGRLRAFRARFGRSWDADGAQAEVVDLMEKDKAPQEEPQDSLFDLISDYAQQARDRVDGDGIAKEEDDKN